MRDLWYRCDITTKATTACLFSEAHLAYIPCPHASAVGHQRRGGRQSIRLYCSRLPLPRSDAMSPRGRRPTHITMKEALPCVSWPCLWRLIRTVPTFSTVGFPKDEIYNADVQ